MAKVLMIQGTMSNAGKSLIVAGLCRIFKQDGYRVAPFKSQNMALNSFITEEGLEMGRAQVMQAMAAGIKPSVDMNPILLKPTSNVGSQVIVNGKVIGNMPAKEYFEYKKNLVPDILKAYNRLAKDNDIIIIEGAGSPAEINLKDNDIVNMGMAKLVDAPVLLVGDIDRGGVFAQLLGTVMLLDEDEKDRIKGLIINKFRGDKTILDPGVEMIEKIGHKKVVGVIPYGDYKLPDEDSLSSRLTNTNSENVLIDIAVIRFPRISNFTDFDVFDTFSQVGVRYVDSVSQLGNPDMIILPGSKNTCGDLVWMRENGLEAAIKHINTSKDCPILGICGGYQMLGRSVDDPYGVEDGKSMRGMELLSVDTMLEKEKVRLQVCGRLEKNLFGGGFFDCIAGLEYEGYEIHMGNTAGVNDGKKADMFADKNVMGTYVHGILDRKGIAETLIKALARKKGLEDFLSESVDYRDFVEREFDRLADSIRENMDMDYVYQIIGIK